MENEWLGEVWMSKYWCGGKQLFDGVKSLLSFFGPDKWYVLSLKLVEWFCYFGHVLHEMSIIRDHSKKNAYFSYIFWWSQMSNCCDFGWICLNAVSSYYKAKIFDRAACEIAFLQLDLKIGFSESCEGLLDMVQVFSPSSREYNDVVDVDQYKVLFAWCKDFVDKSLECEWSIHKSKWYN